jgi:hypothetical protein
MLCCNVYGIAIMLGLGCAEFDSQSGCTALIIGASQGSADCAQLLIDAGANKDAADRVRLRLLLCCCAFLIYFSFPAVF